MTRHTLLLLLTSVLIACGLAEDQHANGDRGLTLVLAAGSAASTHGALGKKVVGYGQLTGYVRRIFQDSRGHYWFGSNGDGIYRYNGTSLEVFSIDEGLAGSQVTGILEDRKGHIWISTSGGVSRFDPSTALGTGGSSFTNYTKKDGLPSDGCWSIFEARDGTIWVGTAAGPSHFDGKSFIPLVLPTGNVDRDTQGYWTACITQDQTGDLWFATREVGAFGYDGRSFPRPIATKGLDDNELACILVDSKDRIWISSMNAGLVQRNSNSVERFSAPDEIGNNEVWTVIEDREGHIWFSSEGYGVYRYDGAVLKNYSTKQGLGVLAVQTIHQDREGRMWFGGSGGLYRLEGDSMVHVKRNGPWR